MKVRNQWSPGLLCVVVFFLFYPKGELWQTAFADTGKITGRITAPGNCNWFECMGYEVILYDNGWNWVQTISTGFMEEYWLCYYDYTFENLSPGTYYVWARAWGRWWQLYGPAYLWNKPWRPAYYPGVLRSANATAISVGEGQTVNVSFSLPYTTYILMGTNPPGYSVIVDGVSYSTPQYLEWTEGDVHTIGVEEYYVNPDSTRSYFREWRHGGPRIQDYTVPHASQFGDVPDTLIARFDYYYRLDILSRYGHPQGGGWHKAWEPVTISVEDSVIEYTDSTFRFLKPLNEVSRDSVLHLFDHWEGSGYGAYTGVENPVTFSLNGMIAERAIWRDQFPLVVQINDTTMGSVLITPCGVWQDKDSTVSLKAIPKPGCAFEGWKGAVSGFSDTISVVMDTSKVIVAEFVRVNRPPSIVLPDTSFTEDDTLEISYALLVSCITDPDHLFSELTIRLSGTAEHFHWGLTLSGISIWADPNWNGVGWVMIEASDPFGAMAIDTVYCKVGPVNDTPGEFDLVFPDEGYAYQDTTEVLEFVWTRSENVDALNGDAIQYTFYLEKKEGETVFMAVVDDTALTYPSLKTLANGEYVWKVKAEDSEGLSVWSSSSRNLKVDIESAVKSGKNGPSAFRLYPNYPNPFNAESVVRFDVPRMARIRMAVYSSRGLLLRVLLDRDMEPGEHSVMWDGTDSKGEKVSSGIYVLKMSAEDWSRFIKMTLLK